MLDLIPQSFSLIILLINNIEECKVAVFTYTLKQQ